jgi:DNA-binding NarL/FixJ family response regulator
MIQVLILDNQALHRDALGSLLAHIDDIAVVGSALEFTTRSDAANALETDVIVIDQAAMNDAVRFIDEVHKSLPGLRTLVLADTAEASVALNLFDAGIDGYITKQDDRPTLLAAIRRVAGGRRYVCPAVGWRIAVNLLQAGPENGVH